jgi:hypothetical protein
MMSIRQHRIPSYRLHKPTGQAVVRLDGRDFYLGKHGTETSQEAYRWLIAKWLLTGRHTAPAAADQPGAVELSASALILAFWRHAEQHYRYPG